MGDGPACFAGDCFFLAGDGVALQDQVGGVRLGGVFFGVLLLWDGQVLDLAGEGVFVLFFGGDFAIMVVRRGGWCRLSRETP